MKLTRRSVLRNSAIALAAPALDTLGLPPLVAPTAAQEKPGQHPWHHGLSLFDDLKYPAGFKHFDYVNPDAPKGGMFSQVGSTRQYNQNFLTFNSLNSYILKGDAALGMELTFAALMAAAADEPDSLYGLAARAVRILP